MERSIRLGRRDLPLLGEVETAIAPSSVGKLQSLLDQSRLT